MAECHKPHTAPASASLLALGSVNMDRHEISLTRNGFILSKKLFGKIIARSILMTPLPFIALFFDQIFIMWFSLAFIAIIIGWQLIAYGIFGEKYTDENLNINVVNYYGKRALIFSAICWALIIISASLVLYLKLP